MNLGNQNPAPLVRVDHLNMTVRDLAESEAWYGRVFGFKRVQHGVRDGTPWAILRQADTMLCLYEYPQLRDVYADGRFENGKHHRIYHFGISVPDPVAWEAVVAREKLEVEYGGAVRYPHSLSWYIYDPTGHEIEVTHWDENRVRFD